MRFILMVDPNKLRFVLMIVKEGLVLHRKYKEKMWRAVDSIGYSILLFEGADFDKDGFLPKSHLY